MNTLFGFVCILLCIVGAFSMTTMPTHHEHPEKDQLAYHYDGISQTVLVSTGSTCYIWVITPDEISTVHTDDGFRNIELRILKEIDAAFYTVVPKVILGHGIMSACGKHGITSYYLVH